MKLKIENLGKRGITAWGSDSGGVNIEPGQTGEVSGKACSCHGADEDGTNDVAGPGFPGAGDGSSGPG